MNLSLRSPYRSLFTVVSLSVFSCLWMGLTSRLQPADAGPPAAGEFRSYSLQNTRARDIEPTLSGLLPPETEIVVDDRSNRILVSGPPQLQSHVWDAISLLDRVRRDRARAVGPVASATELKSYCLAPERALQLAGQFNAEYGPRPDVRIVFDSRTSQILVVAPGEIHTQIAQRLSKEPPAAVGVRPKAALPAAGRPPGAREFQLQHITGEEMNARLLQMLGNRLSVMPSNSPDELAYRLPLAGGRWLMLAVDFRTHKARIEGPGREADSCVRMVQALDSPPLAKNRGISLVALQAAEIEAIRKTAEAVAQRGTTASESGASDTPGDNNMLIARIFQQATQAAAPPPAAKPDEPAAPAVQEEPPATGASDAEEGSLVGPVQVEILEGLGILILKGNRRDVDRVSLLIQEIEQLSVETKPRIVVHHLLHVDCSAVAEMVNQLYQDEFSARQGSVSITALVKPNALFLIGRDESVATVVDLIKQLDRPVEPEAMFKVFRLEHAGAETAREMIEEFYDEREGLGTKILVTADYRTNALIVQASPRDLKEVGAMLRKLDVGDSRLVNELRVFKLQNSIADDLQPILEDAVRVDGGAGRQRQSSDEKSIGLRFVTVDMEGQRLLKSGILTDVRITADSNANALLVSAPADAMPLIEALITELDQLPAVEAQIKVFTIIEGDASNLTEMLEALFGTTTQGRSTSQPPVRTGAVEGDSSLVQLRFAVDARTNSIIATGSAGDLNVVEAILLRLDEADVRNRRTTVIRLCNAPADDVAAAINEYLSNERDVKQIESEFKSAIELVEQEVVVVAEMFSNSLIVSATPRYFEVIEDLVKQLDQRPPMVMIGVLIAEVQLNDTDEFGVELGLQDSLFFDRSLLGVLDTISTTTTLPGQPQVTEQQVVSATNTPGFLFNSLDPLGNAGSASALQNASRVGSQGLSNFSLGRMNNELGFGGLVLSASSEAVSVLIRALQEKRRVDILSRPQIMTLDNQSARVQVGARVPRITGTSTNQTGQTNQVAMEDVGLILGVTPRISPDKIVVMEIDIEKSELGPEAEGIPVTISEGQVIRSPQINTTFAQTTVSAADGQTVVLGGLITNNKSSVTRRVPALADIPILGHLFRYDATVEKRTELLIILTPRIVESEEDAELINQTESERMSWCLADVLELQDNVGFRARGDEWTDVETTTIYPTLDPLMEPVPDPLDDTTPAEETPPKPMPLEAPKSPELIPPPIPSATRKEGYYRVPTKRSTRSTALTITPPTDNKTSYYRPSGERGILRATLVQDHVAPRDRGVVEAYQVAPYVPSRIKPLPPIQPYQ